MGGQGLGPVLSGRERFATLQRKVQGDYFTVGKLGGLLAKEIREANAKSVNLKMQGNRLCADAEIYEKDLKFCEQAAKGAPVPADYEGRIQNEMAITGSARDTAIDQLKAISRRGMMNNQNDGRKRLAAAREWDHFAKEIQKAFDELVAEIASYA